MTTAMIIAILSLLLAFGVDIPTVNNVRAILTNTQATTTPIAVVPTEITPIRENQPVYFGNTAPVNNAPSTPAPVVQSPVMDELKISEVIERPSQEYAPHGIFIIRMAVVNDGKHKKFAEIKMTAQDDSITPEYTNGSITKKTNTESTNNSQDWTSGFIYTPTSSGEKTITFTSGGLTITQTVTVK